MDFRDTYGCCTATMMYGWNLAVGGKDKKTDTQTKLNQINTMIRKGFFLDFAVLYAFTTKTQLETKGYYSLELLEGIGFTRAFDGGKDGSGQRHKETGPITLWAISPQDYKMGLENMKKRYETELSEFDTPESRIEERSKFPDFTLTELIKTGVANRQKADGALNTVRDTFAERIIIDRTAFENHFQHKYGFNPRDVLGLGYWSGPILTLKQYHQAWKRGEK